MQSTPSNPSVLDEQTKRSLLRLLFMVILGFIGYFTFFALMILGGVQFLIVLINGETNDDISDAADKVSAYMARIIDFVTYRSEEKPFPLSALKRDG